MLLVINNLYFLDKFFKFCIWVGEWEGWKVFGFIKVIYIILGNIILICFYEIDRGVCK